MFFWKTRRRGLALALAGWCFAGWADPGCAATPKRVLIVHSFGSAAPPFTTHSTAFEKELTEKMGERVDLDEVSLDVARYSTLDMEEAVVDLLRARQTKWQPDLVVPVGSPAGVFVARHRDRLFPATTPIIYTGMDKRRLPPGTLEQNAAFVGESFDLPGVVEDILQIAPETTNIAVVIGDSPLERFWAEAFRAEVRPFAQRINFIWLNNLSLEGMMERSKTLPPHSFILLVLMMQDAAGVTHNADEALQQIHAVANAPINGLFQEQLGMGIVGGRLYQAAQEGVEAAHIAVRVLHGEPAANFPPVIVEPLAPRYDWRELRKWHIDEKLLPAGSTALFRTPTAWEQYRGWIIGAVSVCATQVLLISALMVNLVRRRRAESSLGESEERVTLAAEAAHLGVWELNTQTGELWSSDKAREIFEFDTVTAINRTSFGTRVHPEDRAMREATIDRAIREQGGYEIEYRVLRQDGTIRWVSGRGRCMGDEEGKPTRLLGVSMDVTERKEAQELFRLATEASPSGMLLVDGGGRIVLVNAHAEELFGYPRDELIGKPLEVLLPGGLAALHPTDRTAAWPAASAEIMSIGQELVGRRKDGSEFPAEAGLNPIQMPRGMLVLATVVDISPQKRAAEEARRQREQIEMLGRTSLLGEMTASLAHELGQPLSAILANASAGGRFIDSGDAETGTLREIYSDIGTDARRARDIIQNVRNAIKKGGAVRGWVSINKVVENVALMVRPDAAAISCEVQMSLADDLPLIEADPVQMQQVFINLMSNAFHAMLETPVNRRRVEIMTRLDGAEWVRVTVRDHGAGFSDENHARLFEHFHTTKKDGLGMGLAIVRSIVEAHRGKIFAANAEGGGAHFEFELPARANSRA